MSERGWIAVGDGVELAQNGGDWLPAVVAKVHGHPSGECFEVKGMTNVVFSKSREGETWRRASQELPDGPISVCPHGIKTEAVRTGCDPGEWFVDMADCDQCDGEPCSAPYRERSKSSERRRRFRGV